MTTQQEIKANAITKLEYAVMRRNRAKDMYTQAVTDCVEAGISNVQIASIAGVSETAIRMWRKRHGIG